MDTILGQPLPPGKVAIYVPSTFAVDRALDESEHVQYVQAIERGLCGLFGGSTSIRAVGTWLSETGDLVREPVTIVQSYGQVTATLRVEVIELARKLATDLRQEAVLIEIDGLVYFARPS